MREEAEHPLFAQFPISGTVTAGGRKMPRPYHVHSGHGTVISGHADADWVAKGFAGQDVHPVLSSNGGALCALFVCRFDGASLGPHLELQMTALAAPQPGEVLPDSPEALLAALVTRPDWGLLSLQLWNDSPDVVAYNSDYLGLSARSCTGEVVAAKKRVGFRFAEGGSEIARGDLRLNRSTGLLELASLFRRIGVGRMLGLAQEKVSRAALINRKCATMPENRRTLTLTAADRMVVTRFDPARDTLGLSGADLGAARFIPTCAEHLEPFRFVYLHPDEVGEFAG